MIRAASVTGLALALAAGCFDPAFSDATRCGPAGECPPGRSCQAGGVCLPGDAGGGGGGPAVTVEKSGAGNVVGNPAALSCGDTCTQTRVPLSMGDMVSLRATPQAGAYFAGWSGACTGIVRDCVFQVSGSVTAKATFKPQVGNLLFVSSEQPVANNIGGVTEADAICRRLASGVGLSGKWVALISSGTSFARSRLVTPGAAAPRGFVRMDGEAVAATVSDLLENHRLWYPIRFDENGRDAFDKSFWTGSDYDGSAFGQSYRCTDWTANDGMAVTGDAGGGTVGYYLLHECSEGHPLLCVQVERSVDVLPTLATGGKKIWVSGDSFQPNMGLAGADVPCKAYRPTGVSDAVALLATTVRPASRTLAAGMLYVRPDGIPVGTAEEITAGALRAAVSVGPDGSPSNFTTLWTGSAAFDMTSAAPPQSCGDWSNKTELMSAYGTPSITGRWWHQGEDACNGARAVYCVEK